MPISLNITILDEKYRILRLIGEGGMARVWLAEEPKFAGRRVAIKEPKRSAISFSEAELRRRFDQEIAIAKMLQSAHASHIVLAHTVEAYGESRLLVMPYMAGGSLKQQLKKHPSGLPWTDAVRIASQVLQGLAALHDLEIVHRDVKPSNILFDEKGEAYLADFGVAQVRGMTLGRTTMLGGAHPGDPAYAAPEQMRNDGGYLTPAADLYALGVVFFEMLTGRNYKTLSRGTRPSQLRPGIPSWLDEVVMKALEE